MPRTPNKTNLLAWAEALESGEFEQCQEELRYQYLIDGDVRKYTYCCLGVATELAVRAGVVHGDAGPCADDLGCTHQSYVTRDEDPTLWDYHYTLGNDEVLPPEVQAWLGLNVANPVWQGVTASQWNDAEGADFLLIAALVRQEYGLPDGPGSGRLAT